MPSAIGRTPRWEAISHPQKKRNATALEMLGNNNRQVLQVLSRQIFVSHFFPELTFESYFPRSGFLPPSHPTN
jgi:hypothetical protein